MDDKLKEIKQNVQLLNSMMERQFENSQQLEESIKHINQSLDAFIEYQERKASEKDKQGATETTSYSTKKINFPISIPKLPSEIVGIRTDIAQEKHERILDLVYHTGFPIYDILRIAVEEYIDQIDPAPRPEMVKKRRNKMGRPSRK